MSAPALAALPSQPHRGRAAAEMEMSACCCCPEQAAQGAIQVGGGGSTSSSSSSRARTERLWKDYFRDPSLWWDNRQTKTNPRAPDFKHKINKEFLWMDRRNNPSWVHDMLIRRQRQEESCVLKGMLNPQEKMNHHHNNKTDGGNGGCGRIGWEILSLEEAVASLEEGLLPQPSVEDIACVLHKCTKERKHTCALRLHAYMRSNGLELHPSLGSHLVSMLVEVGSMSNAQQIFDRLVCRKECSWNSLITGYIRSGNSHHASILYQKMQEDESVLPSSSIFVALLKACAELKDLERGCKIHSEIEGKGLLGRDIVVGNALVSMYARCRSLAKAQELFDKLPVRDVVTWNALITGYVKHGCGEEALKCFKQMQLDGVSPNAVTFVCILKACGSTGATEKGQAIHAQISRKGLETNLRVGSTLVDMYAKFGFLAKAQEVFDKLPVRDVVSWTALIAGYAQHGHGKEALNCFEQMKHEGVPSDSVTFACSLKACGSIGAIDKGREIHAEIARKGLLGRDLFVGNALIDMYAKCGLYAKAQEVFDKLPVRDIVTWNALITGYAQHECGEEALNCFERMQLEGTSPDAVTFVSILKACGSVGAIDKGGEIHEEIARKGLLERDVLVGNALVDMYAKCGLLAKAQEVFDKLRSRDVVSWNALIAGYAQHGCGQEALNCFEQMQLEGISPDAVTFACSLKACGIIGATDKGQEIHAEISRNVLLVRDLVVGNALVDMYVKCGFLAKAQEVFNKLPARNVVSWNALISGHAQHGNGEEALNCFEQMQLDGISPDSVTFVCSLKACGSIGATNKGQEIHAEIAREGLLERDLVVGNALVDMYGKCGMLVKAQEVFDNLPAQDIVSWNALIAGYALHGCGEEALNCFDQMQLEGVCPDAITFVCILKACGSIGATDKGGKVYAEIVRKGLERDLLVGNTLVDMYCKCGSLVKAHEVFDKLLVRDEVLWTALIAGYAQLGESEIVFHFFDKMIGEGIKPNLATFISVLNACSHTGEVDKGQTYFEAMTKDYGIIPTLEHHTCMVDLLGRAGQLERALAMIKKMPFHSDLVVWHTVLGACRKWGNVELGRQAFEHAVWLDEKDPAAYVCMFNIYADANMQEDAEQVEAIRVEKQAWK